MNLTAQENNTLLLWLNTLNDELNESLAEHGKSDVSDSIQSQFSLLKKLSKPIETGCEMHSNISASEPFCPICMSQEIDRLTALSSPPLPLQEGGTTETELRMDAYYYGFEPTGNLAIDRILSAVACAGKGFHHTEDWNDTWCERNGLPGTTPVMCIQNAANDAARTISAVSISDEYINAVIQDIAEYEDRSSPEDQPDMMLVTADELAGEMRAHAHLLAAVSPQGGEAKPKCATCGDTGVMYVGPGNDPADGNFPILEKCGECGYGESESQDQTHDEFAAIRLRVICNMLGLADAVPEDNAELMEVKFSVFGMIRGAIERERKAKSQDSRHFATYETIASIEKKTGPLAGAASAGYAAPASLGEAKAVARDDMGRVTSDYEPSPLEIKVCRDAICREFGNKGTDGYYIRILKAIKAAAPVNNELLRVADRHLCAAYQAGSDGIEFDLLTAKREIESAAPIAPALPVAADSLIERLRIHSENKENTAFARSTMREVLDFLKAGS